MKDKRKYFGLTLALFAGLSFWWLLGQDDESKELAADGPRLPDSYFEGLEIVSHDTSGNAVSRLQAARARHYPDDPQVYLEQLRSTGLDATDSWVLEASQGAFNPDNDILDARGDVRLLRESSGDDTLPVILRTDQLRFDAKNEVATTSAQVRITQGKSLVQGDGLYADLANDYMEIPAEVTARYEE